MLKSDKFMWQILAMIGLNFINYRFGRCTKYLRICIMCLYGFSFIFTTLINVSYILSKRYKEGISYMLQTVNSVITWYFAFSKKKEISIILLKIYRLHKKYNILKKKNSQHIKLLITIILITPYIICIFVYTLTNQNMKRIDNWTFGFSVRSIVWRRIILFTGNITVLCFTSCFVFYLTISVSVLFHRYSEVLSNYNILLKTGLNRRVNHNLKFLEIFFDIAKIAQKLSEHLKNVSFIILFYGLHGIFSTLLLISNRRIHFSEYEYSITLMYYFSCSIIIIVIYTVCSSTISENMKKIKRTAREFINRYFCIQPGLQEYLFYLMRIESEEVVHLSVCGLFYLKRGFLLTALGTILTYGLLLINLNV